MRTRSTAPMTDTKTIHQVLHEALFNEKTADKFESLDVVLALSLLHLERPRTLTSTEIMPSVLLEQVPLKEMSD